jgi:hypothetical protein
MPAFALRIALRRRYEWLERILTRMGSPNPMTTFWAVMGREVTCSASGQRVR